MDQSFGRTARDAAFTAHAARTVVANHITAPDIQSNFEPPVHPDDFRTENFYQGEIETDFTITTGALDFAGYWGIPDPITGYWNRVYITTDSAKIAVFQRPFQIKSIAVTIYPHSWKYTIGLQPYIQTYDANTDDWITVAGLTDSSANTTLAPTTDRTYWTTVVMRYELTNPLPANTPFRIRFYADVSNITGAIGTNHCILVYLNVPTVLPVV